MSYPRKPLVEGEVKWFPTTTDRGPFNFDLRIFSTIVWQEGARATMTNPLSVSSREYLEKEELVSTSAHRVWSDPTYGLEFAASEQAHRSLQRVSATLHGST